MELQAGHRSDKDDESPVTIADYGAQVRQNRWRDEAKVVGGGARLSCPSKPEQARLVKPTTVPKQPVGRRRQQSQPAASRAAAAPHVPPPLPGPPGAGGVVAAALAAWPALQLGGRGGCGGVA